MYTYKDFQLQFIMLIIICIFQQIFKKGLISAMQNLTFSLLFLAVMCFESELIEKQHQVGEMF